MVNFLMTFFPTLAVPMEIFGRAAVGQSGGSLVHGNFRNGGGAFQNEGAGLSGDQRIHAR